MVTNSLPLFGQTRSRVLSLLFGHPDESFYLRQIVRLASVGLGAAQRELRHLGQAGIIQRTVQGRQVYFQADRQSPLFAELHGLVLKTVGVAGVLKNALAGLEKSVQVAFLFGSLAKGTSNTQSDIDVMLVGDVSFGEVVAALAPAQQKLMREVNPVVFPSDEFRNKLAHRDHFLITVLREPRIFVLGSDHELSRLGKQRLGQSSLDQSRRNRRSPRRR
jgi:predicted nucleotidyltransferase